MKENAEVVQGMLTVVKTLRDQQKQTRGAIASIPELLAGIANKEVNVDGQMFQAETQNIIFQLFGQAAPEMKLPEPGIEVDVVLLVMTAAEALDLAAGRAFVGQAEVLKQDFENLAAHLNANGGGNWVAHYDQTPERWRPRGGPLNIAQHVKDTFAEINKSGEFPKPLVPKFYDIRALDPGPGARGNRLLLAHLRKGCIVVIDAISTRHPALLRVYQRSLLDVFPNTSVVTLTPDGNAFKLMKSMVYSLQMSLEDSEFNQRLRDPMDAMACRHYDDEAEMSSWLVAQVRRICAPVMAKDGIRAQIKA
jgi:hypothetical protein